MTAQNLLAANNAASNLASSVGTSSTSITLTATTGEVFPNPVGGEYFVGTISDAGTGLIREVVWCTARNVDVLTVVRAQENTSPLAWNEGDNFQNLFTSGQLATITAALGVTSVYMTAWVLTLPTSLPAHGNWWNNAGVPTYYA